MTRTLVRRTVLLGVTALAAVTLAACGGSSGSSSMPMSGMGPHQRVGHGVQQHNSGDQ
jgi:hypothetical protein